MRKIIMSAVIVLTGFVGIATAHATLPACIHEDGSGQGDCFWNAQTQGNGLGTSVTHTNGGAPMADLAWAAWDASGAVNLVTTPDGFWVNYVAVNQTGWVATEPNEIIVSDHLGNHYLFTVHTY